MRLVLPPNGWYVGLALKKIDGKERRIQKPWPTIEQLLRFLQYWDNCGYDVYYAVAAFKQQTLLVNGKPTNRTHENVQGIWHLYQDVDSKESHKTARYEDRYEAAKAVGEFCNAAKLPHPSLWGFSGGGLHVYHLFTEILELAEWEIYARGFKQLAKDFGLDADHNKTADGSTVLRPPGFRNFKFNPARTVEVQGSGERYPLERFTHVREIGLAQPKRTVAQRTGPSSDSPIAAALIGTLYDDPSDPNRSVKACAQLAAFVDGPGRFSEPFIRDASGICKNSCADGLTIYLSWIDPQYHDAAREKFERWNTGPPLCSTLQEHSPFPELCKSCPHFGKISSPIELGRLAEKKIERLAAARGAPIQLGTPAGVEEGAGTEGLNGFPLLDPPYALNSAGEIVHQAEDKKGNLDETVVADYPIYVHGIYRAETDREDDERNICYAFRHKVPNRPWATITIPAYEYKAGRGIPALAAGGTLIRDNAKFTDYVGRQLGKIKALPRQVLYSQNGFKNGNRDALFADQLYKLGGTIEQAVVSDQLIARIKKGLGLRPGADVRQYLRTYNQLFVPEHYCAHLNLALSGGSIFHPWLTRTAGGLIIINWTPGSARGKSMILWAAGAVWSSARNALSIKHFDTAASQGLILAALGNITVLFDEINLLGNDPYNGLQKLLEFITKVAQGTDKNRALPYGTGIQSQMGDFGQHVLCTSNEDLSDTISFVAKHKDAAEAIIKRLQVLDAASPVPFNQALGDALEAELWNNGGAVAHQFLSRLSDNDVHAHAEALLQQTADGMWKQHRLAADHRIRMRSYAAGKTWAVLAFETGLWPVPSRQHIEDTFGWAVDQIKSRSADTPEETPRDNAVQLLDAFLRLNANNTLRVDNAYKARMVQVPMLPKPQKLVVRYERNTQRAYGTLREFKMFVIEHGSSWREVSSSLKELRIMLNERKKMTLGAGTEYAGQQVDCVEFDVSDPALSEPLQPVNN